MTDDDRELVELVADELRAQPAMEVVWRPESVLQFVGLIQLALRHPHIKTDSKNRETADRFLQAVREYFAGCPMTLELIRRGDDPSYDQ